MRFMVVVKTTPDIEARVMPMREEFAAMGAFDEELVRAGVIEAHPGQMPRRLTGRPKAGTMRA
jgi:glutathione S-transferase